MNDALRQLFPGVGKHADGPLPQGLYGYAWRTSLRQQIVLSLLTVLVFPLSLMPLELQRRMVNGALNSGDLHLLLRLGAVYLAVQLAYGGLKYARNLYQGRIGEGVIRQLRSRVLSVDRTQPNDRSEHGRHISMITAETEQLGTFVAESIAFPLFQGGIALSVLGYMLVTQSLMAVVAIVFLVPPLIVVPIVQRRVNRRVAARTRLLRELSEHMSKDGDTRPQGATRHPRGGYVDRIYVTRVGIYRLKYFLKFFVNLMNAMGPLGILLVGGWLVIRGDTQVGTIVAFLSGYERIADPSRSLLGFYSRLSRMRTQYKLLRRAT